MASSFLRPSLQASIEEVVSSSDRPDGLLFCILQLKPWNLSRQNAHGTVSDPPHQHQFSPAVSSSVSA